MDFELSEQQAAFRDLMRDFARKSISPVAREWELAGRYPEEIVDEMKAMGLFGMLVLVVLAEWSLAGHALDFTRFYIHDWAFTGRAARMWSSRNSSMSVE